MTIATGEFSIAALSRVGIQMSRSDTSSLRWQPKALTQEQKQLAFALSFANGETVRATLVGNGNEPSSLWSVLDALQRLAALPPGWDSFGSKPLHAAAVRRLLSLAPVLLPPDGPEPSVIPTRHGGVQLEWHRSGVDLEVEVPPSDPITFLYADATAQEEREGIGAPNQDLVVRAFSKMISAI